ncbi:MAG: peroxiredoxin [Gammaproteobacteria bacterium]|nr:peroxiredoxin [Gammaproteobacteria bacterium]
MPGIAIGKPIPAFKLESTGGLISRPSLKGKKTVLYFYPKDNTPGCTLEGQDFRDQLVKFTRAGAQVFGVSRDSIKSHEKFKCNQAFGFELISDPDEVLCAIFDVIKMKNMYGKKVRGVERSTFLLDDKGILRREWRKVKVAGHVDEVLAAVKAL